jgi:anti-sigma-K factor RskA
LKHERPTEQIRETAALYALGSLTQHEARSFEMHIHEGCSVCEAEFNRFAGAVADTGLAVEEKRPPEYIADLLAARIEREEPIPEKSRDIVRTPPEQKAVPVPSKPFSSYREQPKPSFFPWILAVFVAVVAIMIFLAWQSSDRTNAALKSQLSAAQADAENLRILMDVQKERVGTLDQILSISGRPAARIVRLAGQVTDTSGWGAILLDGRKNQCVTFGYFPPPPEGKVYQLWFITSMSKIPAGVLKTDPTGRTFANLPLPQDMTNVSAAAVTLEPDNGSQIPTMPFYAVGKVTNYEQ